METNEDINTNNIDPKVEEELKKFEEENGVDITSTEEGQQQQGEEETENKEELIGGKFKTVDDLLKSYKELEKKLGGNTQESQESTTTSPKENLEDLAIPSKEENTTEESKEVKESISLEELAAKQLQGEQVTPEDLKAAGVDEKVFNYYIKGLQAETMMKAQAITSAVGGEENYKNIIAWAKDNLSPEQQESYNNLLQTGDIGSIKLATLGLKAQYDAAVGFTGIGVAEHTGGLIKPYSSSVEYIKDVQRAINDPKYQAIVDQRVEITDLDILLD